MIWLICRGEGRGAGGGGGDLVGAGIDGTSFREAFRDVVRGEMGEIGLFGADGDIKLGLAVCTGFAFERSRGAGFLIIDPGRVFALTLAFLAILVFSGLCGLCELVTLRGLFVAIERGDNCFEVVIDGVVALDVEGVIFPTEELDVHDFLLVAGLFCGVLGMVTFRVAFGGGGVVAGFGGAGLVGGGICVIGTGVRVLGAGEVVRCGALDTLFPLAVD